MSTSDNQTLRTELPAVLAELEPLVEVSQAVQKEILVFREAYDRLGYDAPLPPKSLREMREGRRRYLGLQERLATLAKRYAALARSDPAEPLDPLLRLHGLSLSLLAAVTLYDNYLSLLTLLKDDRLRRLLNDPDYGYGIEEGAFRALVDGLHSKKARRILHELVDAWALADEALAPADATSLRLRRAIESSVAYRHARRASLASHLPTPWRLRRTRFMDALDELGGEALGALSEVFGNGIGLVEWREGKLRGDVEVRRHLLDVLQPLDLLLEKTPFRLTDFVIPGHFGHVAIWLGSEAELGALELWHEPAMQDEPLRSYRESVGERRSVLEALRTGVELNTLEQFLNVDDVAVLRPKYVEGEQVVESLIRGFGQVGKEYDFNFDVETTGSIVCSELPYHVYPGIRWQTQDQLGRFTISPDDIAAMAHGEHPQFELVTLYHDGMRVDPAVALARMAALMGDA